MLNVKRMQEGTSNVYPEETELSDEIDINDPDINIAYSQSHMLQCRADKKRNKLMSREEVRLRELRRSIGERVRIGTNRVGPDYLLAIEKVNDALGNEDPGHDTDSDTDSEDSKEDSQKPAVETVNDVFDYYMDNQRAKLKLRKKILKREQV